MYNCYMDDFTQIKLINNLIDLVGYFYESKQKKSDPSQIRYLKGFCEGIAHTLVESGVLEREEATRILKGVGKKRTPENSARVPAPAMTPAESVIENITQLDTLAQNLDIPTIFRKEILKSNKR